MHTKYKQYITGASQLCRLSQYFIIQIFPLYTTGERPSSPKQAKLHVLVETPRNLDRLFQFLGMDGTPCFTSIFVYILSIQV